MRPPLWNGRSGRIKVVMAEEREIRLLYKIHEYMYLRIVT